MEDNRQNSINIDLPADIAQGSYVNLSIVGHSSNEFIMDFVRLMPGMPKASVTNRLIMTPENAKRFLHKKISFHFLPENGQNYVKTLFVNYTIYIWLLSTLYILWLKAQKQQQTSTNWCLLPFC